MASNTGKKTRKGAVKRRSQTYNPRLESWVKRDNETGRFLAMKKNGLPFKGVKVEASSRVLAFPTAISGVPIDSEAGSDLLPAA
jgi:hypothetical protein